MKFDIMLRPLEVLVVVVVDHLQVEREVGSVSEATALLVVMFVVLSLMVTASQLLRHLLHQFLLDFDLPFKEVLQSAEIWNWWHPLR